jgi:exonuclease III
MELRRLGISIAALSEVRRPRTGEVSEGGFTFYWSGQSNGHRTHGVAVAVASWLVPMVAEVAAVSERLMRVRLQHSCGAVSIISVYAPTENADSSVKDAFYADLHSAVRACRRSDTLLVLGDFNATTGTDRIGYEGCLGPFGSGSRNQNGSLLLDFARGCGLRLCGSWFQRRELHRWTWYSNAGNAAKEIDHILVDGRWRMVRNCRVFRSAQFLSTDHRLLVASLQIRLKSKKLPSSTATTFDLDKLKDPAVSAEFSRRLGVEVGGLRDCGDPEQMWSSFKTAILEAAGDVIGTRSRARKSFISSDTLALIERARKARLSGEPALARSLRRQVVRSLRADKEAFVRTICENVESHLWSSDSQPAYRGIRRLCSPQSAPQPRTIKADDGEVLTDSSQVLTRWAGYFEQLYKADPPVRELTVSDTPVLEADPPINCEPPTLGETQAAVSRMRGGKAAGICGIQAELLKAGGQSGLLSLHAVVSAAWRTGVIPTDWKRGHVVPIWKGKGDRQDCNSYRGVTLLSVPGKVFARLLLDRIRSHLLLHQRLEQSGFTPKRSTVDRILALRVLIERKREVNQGLLAAYIDFRKAFDSVNRDALWRLLGKRGIPPKLISLLSALYSGTASAVKLAGCTSDFFPVSTGVRQGCVLAPTLFNACMDWIMERTVAGSDCGISLAGSKITDLDFADDAVIFAETLEILQAALQTLSEEAEPLGLRVSWIKTKIQAFSDILDTATQTVLVCGENVELTERFTYLGSDIHVSGSCEPEVNRRLGRASAVMKSLDCGVWRCRHLCKRTKVRVFRSLVLPVLLYSCETWTLTAALKSRLNSFGTMALRRILGYRWSDFVSNDRLLQETGLRYVTCMVRERQLRLLGHVGRFAESDPAHRTLFEPNVGGSRRVGRPRASWLVQADRHVRELGMGLATARVMARRRPLEFRHRVDAATRCRGACSHT